MFYHQAFSGNTTILPPQAAGFTGDLFAEPSAESQGGITEVVISRRQTQQVQWLLPLLAQLSFDNRWFSWIAPPTHLEKDWLLDSGIDITKCILLRPSASHSPYHLAVKALRQGNSHVAICWSESEISAQEYEGLERAAMEGGSRCILIRTR